MACTAPAAPGPALSPAGPLSAILSAAFSTVSAGNAAAAEPRSVRAAVVGMSQPGQGQQWGWIPVIKQRKDTKLHRWALFLSWAVGCCCPPCAWQRCWRSGMLAVPALPGARASDTAVGSCAGKKRRAGGSHPNCHMQS